MSNKKWPKIILGLAMAVPVLLVASADAGGDSLNFSGTHIVHYDYPDSVWQNSERRVILGIRNESSQCGIPLHLHLAVDEYVISARELAFDPSLCRSIVEFGTPPDIEIIPTVPSQGMKRETEQFFASGLSMNVDSVAAATVTTSAGQFYVKIEDSPNINVNSVTQTLVWDWDGANAVVGSATVHLDWLTATGWFVTQNDSSADSVGFYAYIDTKAEFKNWAFCNPFAATWTEYNPQFIHGWADGELSGYVVRGKTGDCASLLSFPPTTLRRLF